MSTRDICYFDAKGIFEHICGQLRVSPIIERTQSQWLHPGQSAQALIDNHCVAQFGMVHPKHLKQYKIRKTAVIDINLTTLIKHQHLNLQYNNVSKYPSTTRDVTYITSKDSPIGDIIRILNIEKPDLCNP